MDRLRVIHFRSQSRRSIRRKAIRIPKQSFDAFLPIKGATGPNPNNTYPYNEQYFFSIERRTQARHGLECFLCRFAGTPPAADLLCEPWQSGAVSRVEHAEIRGARFRDLWTVR